MHHFCLEFIRFVFKGAKASILSENFNESQKKQAEKRIRRINKQIHGEMFKVEPERSKEEVCDEKTKWKVCQWWSCCSSSASCQHIVCLQPNKPWNSKTMNDVFPKFLLKLSSCFVTNDQFYFDRNEEKNTRTHRACTLSAQQKVCDLERAGSTGSDPGGLPVCRNKLPEAAAPTWTHCYWSYWCLNVKVSRESKVGKHRHLLEQIRHNRRTWQRHKWFV